MATIWKSERCLGPNSPDKPVDMSLATIRERLSGYRLVYLGEEPRPDVALGPALLNIVVEVNGLDDPVGDFKRRGFYRVAGLDAEDADFLFEPPDV